MKKKRKSGINPQTIMNTVEKLLLSKSISTEMKESLKILIKEYSEDIKEVEDMLVEKSLKNTNQRLSLSEEENTKYLHDRELVDKLVGVIIVAFLF